ELTGTAAALGAVAARRSIRRTGALRHGADRRAERSIRAAEISSGVSTPWTDSTDAARIELAGGAIELSVTSLCLLVQCRERVRARTRAAAGPGEPARFEVSERGPGNSRARRGHGVGEAAVLTGLGRMLEDRRSVVDSVHQRAFVV